MAVAILGVMAGYRRDARSVARIPDDRQCAAATASVPTDVGNRIVPRTMYKLCATQVQPSEDAPPFLEIVEIWLGSRLV